MGVSHMGMSTLDTPIWDTPILKSIPLNKTAQLITTIPQNNQREYNWRRCTTLREPMLPNQGTVCSTDSSGICSVPKIRPECISSTIVQGKHLTDSRIPSS